MPLLFSVGDQNQIKIGAVTNIQDRTVIHTVKSLPSGFPATVTIGNYVTVGRSPVLLDPSLHPLTVLVEFIQVTDLLFVRARSWMKQ